MKKIYAYFFLFFFVGTVINIPITFYLIPNNNDNKSISEKTLDTEGESEILILKGTPEERGLIHGTTYKTAIINNIEVFWKNVHDAGLTKEETLDIVNQRAEVFEREFLDDIIEYRAIAEGAQVPFMDVLALNLFPSFMYEDATLENGCTGWVAHGNATVNGNSLIHKNRDSSRKTQVVVMVAPSGSYHGYRAVITAGKTGVSGGINDEGLAVANVYVSSIEVWAHGMDPTIINREILKKAGNIDDVFEYLDEIIPPSNIFDSSVPLDGSNLLCADKDKVAIIEYTAQRFTTPEQSIIQNGVGYRSNYFITLRGYDTGTTTDLKLRYEAARDFCNEKEGFLNTIEFNELSRHHYETSPGYPKEHEKADGSISNDATINGITFEIDNQYPADLSVMWTALGDPCASIYTPIHSGSTHINSNWTSSNAWNLAESILNKVDSDIFPFGSLIPYYLSFEAKIEMARSSMIKQARACLDNGQTTNARDLLTNLDLSAGNDVYSEMQKVNNGQFWQDSFYYLNGIASSENIEWNHDNKSITLAYGETDGFLRSVPITHGSDWSDSWFITEHELLQGTDIAYNIYTTDNNLIAFVSASEAVNGHNLSYLLSTGIILEAIITSESGLNTPILHEWTVMHDTDRQTLNDTTPPSQVTGLSLTTQSEYSITLSWNPIIKNDLDHYNIYRNGQKLIEVLGNEYTDSGLTPNTTYAYQVSAEDHSKNEGSLSVPAIATTNDLLIPDIDPPSQVTGLYATTISEYSIQLNWNTNIEPDLDHYHVYRNGIKIDETDSNSYADSGLSPSTSYTYKVSAVDCFENEGLQSESASATTNEAQQHTIHVNSIDMSATPRYSWFFISIIGYYIHTNVVIKDHSGNYVAGAFVSIKLTLPNGIELTETGTTDSSGLVSFKIKVDKISGTYISVITSVSKNGSVYNPSDNIETSEILTI